MHDTIASPGNPVPAEALLQAVTAVCVGRQREIELLVAALDSGAHVLLEGPPGTGKSTMLRAVAEASHVPFAFVEGNAELTPSRLVGHFDPAIVIERGYVDEAFVDGPLVRALRDGGLLYVEEINRVPEETINVLLTVMSERELHVPRVGRIAAAPGFRFVAAMNPFDAVGTARISSAIYDRVCRIAVDYQDQAEEVAITAAHGADTDPDFREQAVTLVRETRTHPDVRIGSSVRGAIDMVGITASLMAMRGSTGDPRTTALDAALVSLSGRIRLNESSPRTPEEIVTELFDRVFDASPDDDDGSEAGDSSGEA
ncbi:AAA family ATPase [Euzebya tangerina]|uniref:AAA family ATPase n=1 Tax=Euzebya tangerina TaxID=591198 RepID=UPI000E30F41D|nr:MoxR family ATPase [Euzebya tangerina]